MRHRDVPYVSQRSGVGHVALAQRCRASRVEGHGIRGGREVVKASAVRLEAIVTFKAAGIQAYFLLAAEQVCGFNDFAQYT